MDVLQVDRDEAKRQYMIWAYWNDPIFGHTLMREWVG